MNAQREMQFTFLACADLKAIWDAIAMPSDIWGVTISENLASARDFATAFAQHCELVATNPELGLERGELHHDIRSSTFQKYVLFYRVRGPIVEVVRVLRAAKDVARPE